MLQHYLNLTLRNFKRALLSNLINILGLASGFTCVYFISLWVANEITYDQFHKNYENIYIVTSRTPGESDFRPQSPFFTPQPELYQSYPEIVTSASVVNLENSTLSSDDSNFFSLDGFAATLSFFDIFNFPLLRGDPASYTDSSKVAFITERTARRIFGNLDVVGKEIIFRNQYLLTIAGVISNPPSNSTLQFDFIVPYFIESFWGRVQKEYLMLSKTNIEFFNDKISKLGHGIVPGAEKKECQLFPFERIYLDSNFSEFEHGNFNYILMFLGLGVAILLATIINYINLVTSQLGGRVKEFSVRTLIGSRPSDLFKQFTLDTIFKFVVALLLSIVLVQSLAPSFYQIIQEDLPLLFLGSSYGTIYLALALIATAIICGSILSRFFLRMKPILNNQPGQLKLSSFKGRLTIVQLIVTTTAIVTTITLSLQLEYMLGRDPGYDRENIIKTNLSGRGSNDAKNQSVDYVNQQLSSSTLIIDYDRGDFPTRATLFPWKVATSIDAENIHMLAVGSNFFNLFNIEIVEGEIVNTLAPKAVLNESAIKEYNIHDPIGHKINNSSWGDFEIVGVVKDFSFESSGLKVKPLVIVCQPYNDRPVIVKVAKGKTKEALSMLKGVHSKVRPDSEFVYEFFDEEFATIYRRDVILSRIFSIATLIAIIISIVGLFSLVLAFTQERTREIGIRKIYGAGIYNILVNIYAHFLKKILISFTIATFLSYYLLKTWLNNFEYRIEPYFWIFALSGFCVLVVTMMTISFQAYFTAIQNPVKSLRHI